MEARERLVRLPEQPGVRVRHGLRRAGGATREEDGSDRAVRQPPRNSSNRLRVVGGKRHEWERAWRHVADRVEESHCGANGTMCRRSGRFEAPRRHQQPWCQVGQQSLGDGLWIAPVQIEGDRVEAHCAERDSDISHRVMCKERHVVARTHAHTGAQPMRRREHALGKLPKAHSLGHLAGLIVPYVNEWTVRSVGCAPQYGARDRAARPRSVMLTNAGLARVHWHA